MSLSLRVCRHFLIFVVVGLFAAPLPGFAQPALNVATGFKEASSASGSVVNPQGEDRWFFVLATRDQSGEGELQIRLCTYDHSSCSEYSRPLSESEFWRLPEDPNITGSSYISTTVQDLGLVRMKLVGDGRVLAPTCESLYARHPAMMNSTEWRGLRTGVDFGFVSRSFPSHLGDWKVGSSAGYSYENCALNGWDVDVAWGHL